jgi:sensor histidine kinase YesM
MIIPKKFISSHWLYILINCILIGLVSGVVLSSLHLVVYGLSWKSISGILIFCLFHAFAMAYSIAFYTEILNRQIRLKWIKVPTLFLLGIVGTALATELAYFVNAAIYRIPNQFFDHGTQTIINFSISIIISALVLLYESQNITYRNHFQKQEIEILRLKQLKIKEELEALQSRINPHFLYNSLNTIAALVYDRPHQAEDLTLKLSRLFRYSINYAQQNFVSVKEEIDMICVYLEIEKIRLGDRLQFSISVPPELNSQTIPRFLLQPLVENAFKHGLTNQPETGEIKIVLSRKDNFLVIDIYDNGQGFPQQVNSGQGFHNTYEKLELLFSKQNYEFKLLSQPQKHVHLALPLNNQMIDLGVDQVWQRFC